MEKLEKRTKLMVILGERDRLFETNDYQTYKKYQEVIDYCYNALSYEYQRIIKKSYLEFDDLFKFWWIDEYSKSAFYRKIRKAENAFVNLFEMKYEKFIISTN